MDYTLEKCGGHTYLIKSGERILGGISLQPEIEAVLVPLIGAAPVLNKALTHLGGYILSVKQDGSEPEYMEGLNEYLREADIALIQASGGNVEDVKTIYLKTTNT